MKNNASATKGERDDEDEEKQTMTAILRARCLKDQKRLVRRAARLIGLDEADLIRIGATRYASEILYQPNVLQRAA